MQYEYTTCQYQCKACQDIDGQFAVSSYWDQKDQNAKIFC